MNNFILYSKLIFISLRSQMEYKLSFIYMTVGNFIVTFIEFIALYALFYRFGNISGWTLYEVAVFYGVVNTSFAIEEFFGRGYDIFPKYIRSGFFDRILLRPRSIALQILGTEVQLMRIGRLAQGLLVMLWGLGHLNINIGIYEILLLLIAILGGVGFFAGLFVIQATISFWSIQSLEIVNSFTYGGVQTAQYPITVYKKWFRNIFIYIIPTACVSYFPLVSLLRGENRILGFLSPFAGILFFFITLLIFRIGLRYYSSTGS
jgi:ABC-2 type transport system permease protein